MHWITWVMSKCCRVLAMEPYRLRLLVKRIKPRRSLQLRKCHPFWSAPSWEEARIKNKKKCYHHQDPPCFLHRMNHRRSCNQDAQNPCRRFRVNHPIFPFRQVVVPCPTFLTPLCRCTWQINRIWTPRLVSNQDGYIIYKFIKEKRSLLFRSYVHYLPLE